MTKRQPRAGTGAKSTSVYLTDDERALWDRVSVTLDLSKKDVLLRGLRLLERNHNGTGMTKAELLAEIERRMK